RAATSFGCSARFISATRSAMSGAPDAKAAFATFREGVLGAASSPPPGVEQAVTAKPNGAASTSRAIAFRHLTPSSRLRCASCIGSVHRHRGVGKRAQLLLGRLRSGHLPRAVKVAVGGENDAHPGADARRDVRL